MGNENVEFNEVRCKTLILGDEETGFINLKVSNIDNFPAIEINPNDGNEESSIRLGFQNGRPILLLTNNESEKIEAYIKLSFDEEGMPAIEIPIENNEEKHESVLLLGFNTKGCPVLGLASKRNQIQSMAALHIDDEDAVHLVLSNEGIKEELIILSVDNDGSAIIIKTKEESTDEKQKRDKGILLVNNSKMTLMNVKGQIIGGRNIQEKKNSPKGESND